MVTHYVEDFDGKRNDDAAEPVVFEPVLPEVKVVDGDGVEDKAVKKTAAKKKD